MQIEPIPYFYGIGFFMNAKKFILLFLLLSYFTSNAQYLDTIYKRGYNSGVGVVQSGREYVLGNITNNLYDGVYHYTHIDWNGIVIDTLDLYSGDSLIWLDNCEKCLHEKGGYLYNAYTSFLSDPNGA